MPKDNPTCTPTELSVVEIIATDPNYSSLLDLLESVDLVEAISQLPKATVLAPTNEAIAKIPEEILNKLHDNPELLTQILLYHVSDKVVTYCDLKARCPQRIKTLLEAEQKKLCVVTRYCKKCVKKCKCVKICKCVNTCKCVKKCKCVETCKGEKKCKCVNTYKCEKKCKYVNKCICKLVPIERITVTDNIGQKIKITGSQKATNGYVHALDGVLLPIAP